MFQNCRKLPNGGCVINNYCKLEIKKNNLLFKKTHLETNANIRLASFSFDVVCPSHYKTKQTGKMKWIIVFASSL